MVYTKFVTKKLYKKLMGYKNFKIGIFINEISYSLFKKW